MKNDKHWELQIFHSGRNDLLWGDMRIDVIFPSGTLQPGKKGTQVNM